MAKIWYVKEGLRPNNAIAGPELTLDQCIKLFQGFEFKYLAEQPPEFPSDRNDLTQIRDPRWVVLEIYSSEASENKLRFDKEGFYLVADLIPNEAHNILKRKNG